MINTKPTQPRNPRFNEPTVLFSLRIDQILFYKHLLQREYDKCLARYAFLQHNGDEFMINYYDVQALTDDCSASWVLSDVAQNTSAEFIELEEKMLDLKDQILTFETAIEARRLELQTLAEIEDRSHQLS